MKRALIREGRTVSHAPHWLPEGSDRVFDVDVRDEHDGTKDPFASRLVEMGVPTDQIVLTLHSPNARVYAGHATA